MIKNINIRVSNIQTIKDFDNIIEGNVVIIAGGNDKGKTTLRNIIAKVLGANISFDVTNGAEKGFAEAVINTDQGVYVVKVEIDKEGNETIYLIDKDSKKYKDSRAKTELKDIFGFRNITLEEILSLIKTTEGKRRLYKEMLSILPESDLIVYQKNESVYDKTKGTKYNERTDVNSSIKSLTTMTEAYVKPDGAEYIEHEVKLAKRYEELTSENMKYEMIKGKHNLATNAMERAKDAIVDIDEEIARLEEKKKGHVAVIEEKQKVISDSEYSLEAHEKCLEALSKANDVFTKLKHAKASMTSYDAMMQQLTEKVKEEQQLTADIEAARKANLDIIKSADFGIPDLEISEEGIYIKGLEFDPTKMSNSEMLVNSAMLFRALNKKNNIVLVGNAEGIGSDKLKHLAETSKKNDLITVFEILYDNNDLDIKHQFTFYENKH